MSNPPITSNLQVELRRAMQMAQHVYDEAVPDTSALIRHLGAAMEEADRLAAETSTRTNQGDSGCVMPGDLPDVPQTEPYASAIRGLDTLLRIAVSHIDMSALEISHHTHWALLVQFAGPALKTSVPPDVDDTPEHLRAQGYRSGKSP